jgi:3-oxoacyl-[acyl-carrier protein] reductase
MTSSRIILITGSSANTGLTMARYFAARGDTVVINGRDPATVGAVVKELREAGGQAVAGPADITDPDSVAELARTIEREAGPVDVLIHSATLRHHAPIGELSYKQWSEVIATTLTGGFLTAQAVVGGMAERGRGSILFIGGHSGQSGIAGGTATTAAKSGLIGMTKSLAREVATAGVTVNCLSPGFVRTVRDGTSDARGGGRIPMGRFGTQEEIAASAYFLTGPDAAYITGQVISVNGGVYM